MRIDNKTLWAALRQNNGDKYQRVFHGMKKRENIGLRNMFIRKEPSCMFRYLSVYPCRPYVGEISGGLEGNYDVNSEERDPLPSLRILTTCYSVVKY